MGHGEEILYPQGNGEWMAETLRQRAQYGGSPGYPARLYRYFSADGEHTLSNLRDVLVLSRMRLNARSEFNDPFDSYADWLMPDPIDELREHFYELAIKSGQKESDAQAIARTATEGDGRWNTFTETVRGSIEKAGILCFAECGLNFLMWSHYASKHTGAVVEFYAIGNDEPLFKVIPVRYGDEFPRFKFDRKDFNNQTFRSVLYKSSAWRYEMEWRIVEAPLAKQWGDFDPRFVCSVTLGCRVQNKFRDDVLALVDERKRAGLADIQLFEAKLSDHAFALERVALR